MDNVLHWLKGVPEANFSSMVQEVSACLSYLTPSLPAWEFTSEGPQFPPFGAGTQLNLRLEATPVTWHPGLEAHYASPL